MKIRNSKAMVFIFAIFVNLIIAEAVFYFLFPQPVYAIRYSPWGWEHIPQIRYKFVPESKETVSTIEYNSDGFRGSQEYDHTAPSGSLRVAILGDSEAEGVVDYPYLFPTVLERALGSAVNASGSSVFPDAEVIKAGVYGYEPCQFLRLFESRVLKYKPDLVYVFHNGKGAEDRFCDLDQGRLIYKDLEYTKTQYYGRWFLSYIKAKSQLVNSIYRIARHYFLGDVHLAGQLPKNMFGFSPPTVEAINEEQIAHLKNLNTYTRWSYLGEEFTDKEKLTSNIKAVELTQRVYKRISDVVSNYGGVVRIIIASKSSTNDPIVRYLDANEIEYFDMRAYIADARSKATRFLVNGHWNEYGNYLVGMSLFRIVTELDAGSDIAKQ